MRADLHSSTVDRDKRQQADLAQWRLHRLEPFRSHWSERNSGLAFEPHAHGFAVEIANCKSALWGRINPLASRTSARTALTSPRNYNANQQLFDAPSGTVLYPNLSSITVQDNRGKSDYDALQAQYERRFSQGLQFLGHLPGPRRLMTRTGPSTPASPSFTPITRSNAACPIRISFTGFS